MESTLDCIPCLVEHVLHSARMTSNDPQQQLKIVKQALELIAKMDLATTPPEMASKFAGITREITGVEDAYIEQKDNSTDFALKLLPLLRDEIKLSENPFETIVRFVVAGNIIDFGADIHFKLETAHQRITETLTLPIDHKAVVSLKENMDKANSILFIMDNCGEAVFDRLLIEKYRDKITLAVRGFPILNDITPREVAMSGLTELTDKIIDTGDSTPGVCLGKSKPEFLEVFEKSDLIIAKGQGNYETLSDTTRPIFFLLRVKCKVLKSQLNAELGSINVIPRNIR